MTISLFSNFPVYDDYSPQVPVWCVTPDDQSVIHRFYDTSPISPSERYIALTRFNFEDRLPKAGDPAQVIVIDLESSETVYETDTLAWDTQVGAHVQWGATDEALFFNRMSKDDWRPYGCKANIQTGEETKLEGTVYTVSPDGQKVSSPSLVKISNVQAGYGVTVPAKACPENQGIARDDGLLITDVASGKAQLVLSFHDIVSALPGQFDGLDESSGAFYGFHIKWNVQGTRIMFIIRWKEHGARHNASKNYLITCHPDGTDITMPVDAARWRGGHHPTWCPDGEHIIMNLVKDRGGKLACLQFFAQRVARKLKIRYFLKSGRLGLAYIHYTGKTTFLSPERDGSGHPTLSPDETHILSDAYINERVSFADGTVPLRWIDRKTGQEECLVRIGANPQYKGPHLEWRVDPHPAWSRSGDFLTFNGYLYGHRRVFVADMRGVL